MTPQTGPDTPPEPVGAKAGSESEKAPAVAPQAPTEESLDGSTNWALIYFAKAPIAGQVKTRLCPPLTPEEAAGLYTGFLRDLFRRAVEPGNSRPWASLVYGWMPGDREAPGPQEGYVSLRALVPDGLPLRPQRGGDLWARLRAAFREQFDAGVKHVAVRNSDSPDLPDTAVEAAFRAAGPGKVVLGPDHGGGYWIVVLSAPCDDQVLEGLFAELPDGAASVLGETVSRGQRLGMDVQLMDPCGDVDRFEDLLSMWRARQAGPVGADRSRELVQVAVAAVWQSGDVDVAKQVLQSDVVLRSSGGVVVRGVAAVVGYFDQLRDGFDGLQVHVVETLEDSGRVCARLSIAGQQCKAYRGVGPEAGGRGFNGVARFDLHNHQVREIDWLEDVHGPRDPGNSSGS